jgi:hypothetical protein
MQMLHMEVRYLPSYLGWYRCRGWNSLRSRPTNYFVKSPEARIHSSARFGQVLSGATGERNP